MCTANPLTCERAQITLDDRFATFLKKVLISVRDFMCVIIMQLHCLSDF